MLRDRLASHPRPFSKPLVKPAKGGAIQAAKLILERTLLALHRAQRLPWLAQAPASHGRTLLWACARRIQTRHCRAAARSPAASRSRYRRPLLGVAEERQPPPKEWGTKDVAARERREEPIVALRRHECRP